MREYYYYYFLHFNIEILSHKNTKLYAFVDLYRLICNFNSIGNCYTVEPPNCLANALL